jgi:hypothetical protein
VAGESGATTIEEANARISSLENELAVERASLEAERERSKWLMAERDRLREAYRQLLIELELMKRRIFAAKAERVDSSQLELEFEALKLELDALAQKLGMQPSEEPAAPPGATKPQPKPKGRRDLSIVANKVYPTEIVEVKDEEMEALVAAGLAERIGSDDASSVKWRKGCLVIVTVRRLKYRLEKERSAEAAATGTSVVETSLAPAEVVSVAAAEVSPTSDASTAGDGDEAPAAEIAEPRTVSDAALAAKAVETPVDEVVDPPARPTTLVTATMPPTIIPRSMGTPSLFAHVGAEKFNRGMPLFRLEDKFYCEGLPIGRDVMCRWLEEIGGIFGCTVVYAMREDALRTAFCLATDATGVLVQPMKNGGKTRQACHRGHFFVVIADRDHVFFEYTAHETSHAVLEMFRGFSGYVQADAKSVYDILFRDHRVDPPDNAEPDFASRSEVGCWYHARHGFFDAAAVAKEVVAREALFRIRRLYQLEERWRGLAPEERKEMRDRFARPEVELFLAWVELEYERIKDQRGLLRSALGYVHRQREALRRYLEDGRLEMDNGRSERQLKRVATGRKAWLFVGSDDHAEAAAAWFSMIASAKLHRLEPEAYLRDVMRVLPQWPRDRYLELSPKYWAQTRARLDPAELDQEIGWLTIPPPPSDGPAHRC